MANMGEELSQLLRQSLNASERRNAEQALRTAEDTPAFSIQLLHIVANTSAEPTIRLAAALYFKNFIRRNWTTVDGDYKLPLNEVNAIKQEIVGLMLTTPTNIQSQLGEAVSTIADSDFWERWQNLMSELGARLTPNNPDVNAGVLQVGHSIFKRWRPLFRSDELFTEINHVITDFGPYFWKLMRETDAAIDAHANDKAALTKFMNVLNLIFKIQYDLSCQDLPPFFEDNIAAVSTFFGKYISYDNSLLHTDDETESGILEYVKASIFQVLTLFMQKYGDAFGEYIPQHVTSCWNFLTNVGAEPKYDVLVSKALQFLTAVAFIPHHTTLFASEHVLTEVIQRVIIPNLTLRESDLEMFEDEPIEYIRRDLEGSDNDTRRRGATDLLRQLVVFHHQNVTTNVSSQITSFLSEYSKNPSENWKYKDTAVYLFNTIAAKGHATTNQGVLEVNAGVDISNFFKTQILQDLGSTNVHPILQVDAIKFIYLFRGLLGSENWHASFPSLVQHLNSSNYVIYTYAAIVVERALALTGDDKMPIIPREEALNLSTELLKHLFQIIQKESDPAKVQENEFLIRCIMRVLIVIKDGVLPILDMVLQNFINITNVIRQNPSNPKFYYYHFEGIGALIRFAAPSQPDKLEKELYEPFASILQNDVQEFMPYVFQLFAALLEANPSGTLSEYYLGLITPILQPVLWESKGNIPALVRLLNALIPRAADKIQANNQLEPILGIFQKLLSAKHSESYGFDLLETIVTSFDPSQLQQFFQPIFQILLTRLDKSKTDNFVIRLTRLYYVFAARQNNKLGTDAFVTICDSVQNDIFRPVYTKSILPDTQKLTRFFDRKVAVVGLTMSLADSQAFESRYPRGWSITVDALLKLLINPPILTTGDDTIVDADAEDPSFGVGFTPLNTCRKPVQDPYPEASDVKAWVGTYLKEADTRHGGRIAKCVQERLSTEQQSALSAVMN